MEERKGVLAKTKNEIVEDYQGFFVLKVFGVWEEVSFQEESLEIACIGEVEEIEKFKKDKEGIPFAQLAMCIEVCD